MFTRNKIYFKQRKTASRNTSLTDPTNISNNQTQDLSAIKIAHTNINGIRNKVDHVSAELSDYDIICVSETKLNPTITNDKIEINGFKPPLRKDRALNNGGGLAIYSKNNIHSLRRQDLENNNIENIWTEVQSSKNKFLIGLFYRPPNSPAEFWNHFEDTLETAADLNHDMIILGDFNTDILNNNSNRNLVRIMQKFDLDHTINEATRTTENSETCLDLIMTNHKAIIQNTQILAPFQSDHCTDQMKFCLNLSKLFQIVLSNHLPCYLTDLFNWDKCHISGKWPTSQPSSRIRERRMIPRTIGQSPSPAS